MFDLFRKIYAHDIYMCVVHALMFHLQSSLWLLLINIGKIMLHCKLPTQTLNETTVGEQNKSPALRVKARRVDWYQAPAQILRVVAVFELSSFEQYTTMFVCVLFCHHDVICSCTGSPYPFFDELGCGRTRCDKVCIRTACSCYTSK